MRKIKNLFSDIQHWFLHRLIPRHRYNVVYLRDLKPGYYEPEDRLFHSMMQILCDFVEVELPWLSRACDPDRTPKPAKRDREAGLRYLDWEIGLKYDEDSGTHPDDPHYGQPTGQAKAAIEIQQIYLWYRDVYQKRLECGEESGLYACKKHEGPEWETVCKRYHELEEDRRDEDAAYMKRLIDVRRSMWT
jgi:hypothetical protein